MRTPTDSHAVIDSADHPRVWAGALDKVFAEAPAAHWETRLSAAGIPCGMIRDVAEAVSLPALEARRLKLGVNVPGLPEREQVEIVNAGFLFSEDQPRGRLATATTRSAQ